MGEWDTAFVGFRIRATDTKTFTFDRPPDFEYTAGQFFFVMLRSSTTRPIEHHFSFSSSPTEPVIEFTTRMTGSDFKNRMEQLHSGDQVHLAGPDGAFVLQPEMRKVAFLSAGIGITPARSTLRWVLDSDADVDITVLQGEHDQASCAFAEEFAALDSDHARVVTVLSHPEAGWDGRRGHLDADVVREEVPDFADRHFFVSGPAPVVDSLVSMLVDQVGVTSTRIMSEHFPGYAGAVETDAKKQEQVT